MASVSTKLYKKTFVNNGLVNATVQLFEDGSCDYFDSLGRRFDDVSAAFAFNLLRSVRNKNK